ncbi:tetratricopeptide repeat protein [Actinacidiphila acididurans]|uniref:Tetratricopeptide repeat protein n=1 Tax=Actinacidiphila acididurans TaxID=2784346 RepID=A0ABS2TYX7_9ACTN|nr:tetratricopeptide repeat protein [Actinacidiphila acididurans]MBM9508530.1 tetratricopeptide repeat protein [Actinacidiphila acididurans]
MAWFRREVPTSALVLGACAAAFVVAVPVALQSAGIKARWLLVLGVLIAAVAGVLTSPLADSVKARWQRAENHRGAVLAGCLTVPGEGRLPLVHEVTDPTYLGVRPTWSLPDEPASPPYVRRDVHEALVRHLRAGKFVLLVGERLTGTTRTAYEAMREALPEHLLVAPQEPESLRAAIEHSKRLPSAVLWLDQIDRYLQTGGLTLHDVQHLVDGGKYRAIVATIRSDDLQPFLEGTTPELREIKLLLLRSERVLLPWQLSQAELDRAYSLISDERIAAALRPPREFGLAEYFGAGPLEFERWRNAWGANPRGASLVRAAVDCRRLGLTRPLARGLLQDLHTVYLRERPRWNPEPLGDAWAWALEQREGTVSLLFPSVPSGGESPVDVFPYLVDATEQDDRARDNGPVWVSEDICAAVLNQVTADEAEGIAAAAHAYGHPSTARRAFQSAIFLYTEQFGATDIRTLSVRFTFARWLHVMGDLLEARQEVRTVVDAQGRALGSDHPQTLASRHLRSLLSYELGDTDAAVAECEGVLAIRVRLLGDSHELTVESRQALDAMREERGSPFSTLERLRADVEARSTDPELGPDHHATLASRFALVVALQQTGHLSDAMTECRAVLDIRRRALGEGHRDTLACADLLRLLEEQAGEFQRS